MPTVRVTRNINNNLYPESPNSIYPNMQEDDPIHLTELLHSEAILVTHNPLTSIFRLRMIILQHAEPGSRLQPRISHAPHDYFQE